VNTQKHSKSPSLHQYGVTRRWLPQRAGSPSLNGDRHGGTPACIPTAAVHITKGSAYEHELPWNTSSSVYSSSFHHENSKNRRQKVFTSTI